MSEEMETLRYPVGRPALTGDARPEERERLIGVLADLPMLLRDALDGLTDDHLDTAYRPDGWTVRQVVHHLADSHVNAYVRFKLAATEPEPTIRPYDENAWAREPEALQGSVEMSLVLLEGLHRRWTTALRELPADAWERTLLHPESGPMNLVQVLQLYAWHSKHHLAHITRLRDREAW